MPTTSTPPTRRLDRLVSGLPTSDGAGVELVRVIGSPRLPMLDPFLLLDVFRSDNPADYLGGFPSHPHRGFETVTYMLAGRMGHKDNAGHEGVIEAGGVQWMSAGRGIVHSEMPEQAQGLLAGFQLWINLPAAHKMDAPAYQEFSASQIPVERRDDDTELKVIAGQTSLRTHGPVQQPLTDPYYLDVILPPSNRFSEPLPAGHNAFVFVFQGQLLVQDTDGGSAEVNVDQLGTLGAGERFSAMAGPEGARFLLVAGRPMNEPVARGGPFVMNTEQEIRQAFADFRGGRL